MRPQREKIAGVKEKNELRRKMTPGHYFMGSLFFLIGSTLRLLRVSLFILCYFGNPTKKKPKQTVRYIIFIMFTICIMFSLYINMKLSKNWTHSVLPILIVELSWWQIRSMWYFVPYDLNFLVNVLKTACQLFNIFYKPLCLWQNV